MIGGVVTKVGAGRHRSNASGNDAVASSAVG